MRPELLHKLAKRLKHFFPRRKTNSSRRKVLEAPRLKRRDSSTFADRVRELSHEIGRGKIRIHGATVKSKTRILSPLFELLNHAGTWSKIIGNAGNECHDVIEAERCTIYSASENFEGLESVPASSVKTELMLLLGAHNEEAVLKAEVLNPENIHHLIGGVQTDVCQVEVNEFVEVLIKPQGIDLFDCDGL